jgi:benzoate-CoA ligase
MILLFGFFSGGTTGTPKAIVQPHRSFMYTTECYAKRVLGYQESDRVLSVPKLYFGYATGANLIFPFSVGATAILFSKKPSVEVLLDQIKKHRPTLLINVPTVINRLLAYPNLHESDLQSIRITTSAGEALPAPLHEEWTRRFKTPLLDGLGTAEMWHIFLTNRVGGYKVGTLGQVVEGFDISLRDAHGQEVPQGEAGIMWVKGGARALRYWRQNEASFNAFRGEWYVSGDLLRQDQDGFYTYCGRQDDMIKVAGKWVSPKEVEDVLMCSALIHECAVVGKPDKHGLLKAYAYYTTSHQSPLSIEQEESLKKEMITSLDRYKLPKSITFVEQFKRTHLGKIDRGALKRL